MSGRSLFFILSDPHSEQVMFLRDGTQWKLPPYDEHVQEDVGFLDPGPFNSWFAERCGINVLRRYAIDLRGTDEALFVLEMRMKNAVFQQGAIAIVDPKDP